LVTVSRAAPNPYFYLLRYTSMPTSLDLFVPGRICLFGEHSDWAGGYRRMSSKIEKGYALICGTNQGIYARVAPHPNSIIIRNPDHSEYSLPLTETDLLNEAMGGGHYSYLAGVAHHALVNYHVKGLVIDNYLNTLPIQKGLSSSAAICVLVARAFNQLYQLHFTQRGEMELAYQGEITTPSRCGRMDQGCAFGQQPILMTFDADRLEITPVEPAQDLYYVIVDLQGHKDTLKILSALNHAYPVAQTPQEVNVQNLFGLTNKKIVRQAIDAIETGAVSRLGSLMRKSQKLFDTYAAPLCPEELTAPRLHQVLSYPALKPYLYGGKGVGSQGDGSAQLLVKNESSQKAVMSLLDHDLGLPCLALPIPTKKSISHH